jgi:hypothetical protein
LQIVFSIIDGNKIVILCSHGMHYVVETDLLS